MKAQEIIASHEADWGSERNLYPVSREEFEIILHELDLQPVKLNVSNGDGTFYSEIAYEGKRFCYSGQDKISGQSLL